MWFEWGRVEGGFFYFYIDDGVFNRAFTVIGLGFVLLCIVSLIYFRWRN